MPVLSNVYVPYTVILYKDTVIYLIISIFFNIFQLLILKGRKIGVHKWNDSKLKANQMNFMCVRFLPIHSFINHSFLFYYW